MFDLRHRQYVRILIIEEEPLVRAALVALITSWEGFHVVAEAATKVEGLEQFRRVHPDVVLLSLAGTDDATLVPEISRAGGRTRLVVLFSHCPEDLRLVITGLAKRVSQKPNTPINSRKPFRTYMAKDGHEGVRWSCFGTLVTVIQACRGEVLLYLFHKWS
jgi:CheY-like chemotaxis protein